MTKTKWKTTELPKECRAALSLLIREVQDCKTKEELDILLKSWVEANDLHPEKVSAYGQARSIKESYW